jgi:hypothetical protein
MGHVCSFVVLHMAAKKYPKYLRKSTVRKKYRSRRARKFPTCAKVTYICERTMHEKWPIIKVPV